MPGASLGLFRWVFGLYLLLLELPSWSWLHRVPVALFDPPPLSPAALVPSFPGAPFFAVLDVLLVVCLCAVIVGYRTRAFTAAYLALVLVGTNFNYCFGKIDHGSVLSSALLAGMAWADWGRYYSVDSLLREPEREPGRARTSKRALSLFAAVLAFGMLTAGLPKAWSWIDFDLGTSGFLAWYYPNRESLGRDYLLAPLVPQTPLLALELADYVGASFEMLGIFALVSTRRLWRGWLMIAALFHLANAAALNIAFTQQALVYAVFADLSRLAPPLPRPEALRRALRWLVPGVCALGALRVGLRLEGIGTAAFFTTSPERDDFAGLLLALPGCALAAGLLAYSAFKEPRSDFSR
ncbi:MAG: hypothetical protein EOO73_09330 [Myxococcales bacterium]|nr:MAG: hypothetical protein EOO73_09330 [Myxococcales bacterium]